MDELQLPPTYSSTPKRVILIAAFCLLLFAIVLIVVFLVGRGRAERALLVKEQMEDSVAIAEDACDQSRDPEACKDTIRNELAQSSGNTDYCQALTGEAYDTCIQMAVYTSNNAKDCDLIKDEARRGQCRETQSIVDASGAAEIEACEAISDEEARNSCEEAWLLRQVLAGNCEPKQVSAELCAVSAQLLAAIAAEDPDQCQLITDENYQGICLERTLPGDRDHDGLDQNEEDLYGTSDTDADSDDDGYNDDVEVRAGYSPIGSGLLND